MPDVPSVARMSTRTVAGSGYGERYDVCGRDHTGRPRRAVRAVRACQGQPDPARPGIPAVLARRLGRADDALPPASGGAVSWLRVDRLRRPGHTSRNRPGLIPRSRFRSDLIKIRQCGGKVSFVSASVVTVSRSLLGRVTVKWFDGEDAAERDAWVAKATARGAEVRGNHSPQDCLAATCTQTLLQDGVDLSWRATHRRDRRLGHYLPVA